MSGVLGRSKLFHKQRKDIISLVASIAEDEEAANRPSVEKAIQKLAINEPVAGLRTLSKYLSSDDCASIGRWLEVETSYPGDQSNKIYEADALNYSMHIITAGQLAHLDLLSRSYIIEPWLPRLRWFNCLLPGVLEKRGLQCPWQGGFARRALLKIRTRKKSKVLYVDGEMALQDLKQRLNQLTSEPPDNLFFLPSEKLFQLGCPINIFEPSIQQALTNAISQTFDGDGGLIVLDNLSSLSAGVNENDNSEQQPLSWLIGLRHAGYSVMLVHHAGKNNEARGASRREDILDTVIKLSRTSDFPTTVGTAHFELTFTKSRQKEPTPNKLDLKLTDDGQGLLIWSEDTQTTVPSQIRLLHVIKVYQPESQTDLASHILEDAPMGLTIKKSQVNRYVRDLKRQELIQIDGAKILVTVKGDCQLTNFFPNITLILQRGLLKIP